MLQKNRIGQNDEGWILFAFPGRKYLNECDRHMEISNL